MRSYVRMTLEYLGIIALVILIWQLLEKILFGEITPNLVDSIIGTILSYSIYKNYKNWIGY